MMVAQASVLTVKTLFGSDIGFFNIHHNSRCSEVDRTERLERHTLSLNVDFRLKANKDRPSVTQATAPIILLKSGLGLYNPP